MPKLMRRQIAIIVLAVLGAVLLVYLLLPSPVEVRTARVGYAPLQVIVEEEGETRVKNRFTISSPVAATIRRIHLEAGDRVRQGQPLVFLEGPRMRLLRAPRRPQPGWSRPGSRPGPRRLPPSLRPPSLHGPRHFSSPERFRGRTWTRRGPQPHRPMRTWRRYEPG